MKTGSLLRLGARFFSYQGIIDKHVPLIDKTDVIIDKRAQLIDKTCVIIDKLNHLIDNPQE